MPVLRSVRDPWRSLRRTDSRIISKKSPDASTSCPRVEAEMGTIISIPNACTRLRPDKQCETFLALLLLLVAWGSGGLCLPLTIQTYNSVVEFKKSEVVNFLYPAPQAHI